MILLPFRQSWLSKKLPVEGLVVTQIAPNSASAKRIDDRMARKATISLPAGVAQLVRAAES